MMRRIFWCIIRMLVEVQTLILQIRAYQGIKRGKRTRQRQCPVCSSKFTHVRRYVIQEHIPWFIYPRTSCWKYELRYALRKRTFPLFYILFAKFDKVNSLSFINTNERCTSCQGPIWQEDDLEHILYYLNKTKQHFSLTKMPYPAQDFTCLFHWKKLRILLDMARIHIVCLNK